MASSSSCQAVAGVWSRLFEEDPLGDKVNADCTTLVLWTQAPESGIYVDLRLPKGSPGRSDTASIMRQPYPAALRATTETTSGGDCGVSYLSQQKSFAGILTFKKGDTSTPAGRALAEDKVLAEISKVATAALPLCTCFWRRDIDYQPPSGGLDIGVCASYSAQTGDGEVDLRETGDDGTYAEGWRRLGKTHTGPVMALELISENGQPRKGFWVRTGHRFAYAVGRPETKEAALALGCPVESATLKDQVGKTLEEVLESSGTEKEQTLAVIGSYVGLAGEIISEKDAWRILDSTNPGLVDCHLVGEDMDEDDTCCSILRGESSSPKEGDTVVQIIQGNGTFVRKWRVVELSDCSLPFIFKTEY